MKVDQEARPARRLRGLECRPEHQCAKALQVRSRVGAHRGGRPTDVSPSIPLPSSPPLPLSLKPINISSGED